ncbi:MAG TPA: EpsD family peptidyl-prolyl cis-trans isomerase [Rhodocyclaceae bacterium]|nr:EpsD family peptidyl-prolyl cis-trans isomerase [Rhodocyclaceae bacterium]
MSGFALVLLSACSDGKTIKTAAEKAPTEVAARVNGEDIPVSQVNAVMSLAPEVKNARADQARQRVLDKLIDQQVVYAQAVDKKLDRDPHVMLLLDAAKREIVARAYLDSLMNAPTQITQSDMHQYYVENPDLFAQRKVFDLEQIITEARPELNGPLKRMVNEGRSMDDIGKFLADKDVDFKSDNGVRTAEQIPLDVLPRLADVKDGRMALIESGQRFYLIHVLASKLAPVSEAEARPRIEMFLSNQQGQRIVAQEIKRLRESAHIEYMGDFASLAGPAQHIGAVEKRSGSNAKSDSSRSSKAVAVLTTERNNRD